MAFWHGRILPATYYFRRRGIVVITSENFDGEWIAGIIERFGYGTARGSTSRGARKALLQLTRDMAAGKPAAFTLDGPRGPARVAQPGAVWLAKATGNPVLPFHLEASRHWTLRQLGPHADSEAVRDRRDRDRRAVRRRRRMPTTPAIEAGAPDARSSGCRRSNSARVALVHGAAARAWIRPLSPMAARATVQSSDFAAGGFDAPTEDDNPVTWFGPSDFSGCWWCSRGPLRSQGRHQRLAPRCSKARGVIVGDGRAPIENATFVVDRRPLHAGRPRR